MVLAALYMLSGPVSSLSSMTQTTVFFFAGNGVVCDLAAAKVKLANSTKKGNSCALDSGSVAADTTS